MEGKKFTIPNVEVTEYSEKDRDKSSYPLKVLVQNSGVYFSNYLTNLFRIIFSCVYSYNSKENLK
ncbi:hypothetical protein KUTeg_023738 [Tegillarca granosa]|uniref:Uncharacterized protein n=1 Tax=Tegillarca granosa TaxID=220873 RepID=A0ABQ9E2J1_TEGGR|nr:hypothetical protein KUTeg_023738 [Tegillarca granosa]